MPRYATTSPAFLALLLATSPILAAQVEPVTTPPSTLRRLPLSTAGRVLTEGTNDGDPSYSYQWPGLYFEAAFKGKHVYFKVGRGEQILHVLVDHQPATVLDRPAPGLYEVKGLTKGKHAIRIEVVTESQDAPKQFGGFSVPRFTSAATAAKRERQMEFIGDSYTVGYDNLSTKLDCTTEEVWAMTDNSRAFGPLTAKHFDADYQINAISGRGIVRNYNGGNGDPLPVAYPFVQFDKQIPYEDTGWHPQVIVIGLGTNDFSTQLNAGERWFTREDLHASYEESYGQFLQNLRARNADAFFILMATDGANGEIQSEVKRVVAQLVAAGEQKVAFIPMNGLAMTGCHSHPSAADDEVISDELIRFLDSHPQLWQGK